MLYNIIVKSFINLYLSTLNNQYNLNNVIMTLSNVKKTSSKVAPDELLQNSKNSQPAIYYQKLDYASKILFKREVLQQLKLSPKTFHRRMSEGSFRPGELVVIDIIILHSPFLKLDPISTIVDKRNN